MVVERLRGTFGDRLRSARERRGLSLRQIADTTKISLRALEALERNHLQELPGGLFSRAFVRSYATEVGLDPDEMVHEFLAEVEEDAPAPERPAAVPDEDFAVVESNRRIATTFLRLIAVSAPLVGLVLYFGVSGGTSDQTISPVAVPAPVTTTAEVPPRTEPIATPVAASDPASHASTPATAGDASAIPRPEVTTGRITPASVASDAVQPAPAGSDAVPAVDPKSLVVELVVTRPCWVSATVDGTKAIERLLKAGEREKLNVSRELSVTAADGAAVRLVINGQDAKPLGKAGDVVTVRVTPDNFKTLLSTR